MNTYIKVIKVEAFPDADGKNMVVRSLDVVDVLPLPRLPPHDDYIFIDKETFDQHFQPLSPEPPSM